MARLRPLGAVNTAPRVLLCLAHAGGGLATYREWPSRLSPEVDVMTIELAGRDGLINVEPVDDLALLIGQISRALDGALDRPFAVFGHSLGALIGYELVRSWRDGGGPRPSVLFASGRAAPHLVDRRPPIHDLSDDDFIAQLARFEGTPSEVLEHRELMELLIPSLRADFRLNDTYRHPGSAPLDVPIVALAGTEDADVRVDQIDAWRDHTTASFALETFQGGHFFVETRRDAVISVVRDHVIPSPSEGCR